MKKGMTKVSVLYPNGENKTFDMDYYCNTHLPMVSGLLGDFLKGATVEKGLGTLCFFPSFLLHRVTPLTSGATKSLVTWLCGANLR